MTTETNNETDSASEKAAEIKSQQTGADVYKTDDKDGMAPDSENSFSYPPAVIKQATEENDQVQMHAITLFNKIVDMRFQDDGKPWNEKFNFWPGKNDKERQKHLNATLRLCFELADQFLMGGQIDLKARLKNHYENMNVLAPTIFKPSAKAVKDTIIPGQVPGLHD